MARENKKIDQVQYQELIESFKKLEDDRFPVSIDHSYGKGVIDSVRVTGHNRDRVRLFKEFARDAVTLFEIPCAGYEVEMWIRLVFEYVPQMVERNPYIGGGLVFSDPVYNAAEASVIAMHRLYSFLQVDTTEQAEGKPQRRKNRTPEDICFDNARIFAYISENPQCTRDEITKDTGITNGLVSASKAWKEFLKSKKEVLKANTAKNVKDIESFPS